MKRDNSHPVTVSLGFGIGPTTKPDKKRTNDGDAAPVTRKPRILVVDPDANLRRMMSTRLGTANYAVELVESAEQALDAAIKARPHLVITELRMQPMDGLALLKELKSRWPEVSVIILTGHGTIPDAVQATLSGAFGFLVKPLEREELMGQVERAIAVSSYTRAEGDWRANIVSRSKLMEDRLAQANLAAAGTAPVLLTGENGTGKELLARAIHAASARRDQPFIVLRCQSADEDVMEAELFGGGSSVGALRKAHGGTLMLDEITELPLRLQSRLFDEFRSDALDGRDHKTPQGDVKLICTTSRDLKAAMFKGELRSDLYYQICTVPIEIPPLGRRREDIPLLVSHFLEQATEESGKQKIYSAKAIELLATTDWPGNVRQLFDLVKQNVALSQGKVMSEDLVRKSLGRNASVPSYQEARQQFSREYVSENLQRTSGNVSAAARLAKRNRTDFYKLLTRCRLNADDFKTAGSPGVNAESAEE